MTWEPLRQVVLARGLRRLQSPEGLAGTGGSPFLCGFLTGLACWCWLLAGFLVPLCKGLSTVLLKWLRNVKVAFPRNEWSRENGGVALPVGAWPPASSAVVSTLLYGSYMYQIASVHLGGDYRLRKGINTSTQGSLEAILEAGYHTTNTSWILFPYQHL